MKMIYLDHAATTPMVPLAVDAMQQQLTQTGNASSLHAAGRRARRVVEESREQIADALGARPSEVIFTSGGTESNNLALKGLFWSRHDADGQRQRVVTSAVEHHAVLDPVHWLAKHEGAEAELLTVDASGSVDPAELRALCTRHADEIALVSVMWANSEVGSVQPIQQCAEIAAESGIPFHTDAVQAVNWVDVDFSGSGFGALSLSGHKVGGPLGVGALLLSRNLSPVPLLHGGGQERDVRSGTLDVPAIAALAAAISYSRSQLQRRRERVAALRDRLVVGVLASVPDAILNGPDLGAGGQRLPSHAHFSFPGCEGDSLLLLLDARDICCSTGSACSAGVAQPSHVLLAMGADRERARSSLRFSLGHDTTDADVDGLTEAIGPVVARARGLGSS